MHNDSQTIGDRVIVNPRFKLATLRDREGRIREHVRLSMEVCGCGYSYARPGVGYAGKTGWHCKRCGQLHTTFPNTPEAPRIEAHRRPDPERVAEFDEALDYTFNAHNWLTAGDIRRVEDAPGNPGPSQPVPGPRHP